ncbi:MAG: arginine--tRNA ligase [Nevskiaceae bacterium]|jgi:arginyl-tRNA synthetase|nr:arginine--tRNA ligase [Nevskiaceae bacterium]
MKQDIEQQLHVALAHLRGGVLPENTDLSNLGIERTRDPANGDFATNVAMRLAKAARKPPRELAQAIVSALPPNPKIARVEIAGAGFINFFLAGDAQADVVRRVFALGDAFGRNGSGGDKRIVVEFVSSNPTGPLHVGHGRGASYGASVANLLEANGWAVHREYYINDAGRQMDIIAASVWLRYLEACGEALRFPANGYKGDYVREIAAQLLQQADATLVRPVGELLGNLPPDEPEGGDKDAYIDALIERARELLGEANFLQVADLALDAIIADMRNDLEEFGVTYDRWFSERSLATSGAIDRALERLQSQGHLYRKDGALWFAATTFGDEKDRVVVRENGVKTYFASDIAYHLDKRERGFEVLLDIWGADHHGYIARVKAGLEAMGEPPASLDVQLVQFVSLFRGAEKVAMSTRAGEFITLRQLRAEVGNDAARFFYVMRGHDQHLDFDLELAKSRSNENPVYYIQYAHARVASVLRQLAAKGLALDTQRGLANLSLLTSPHETAMLTAMDRYPDIIATAGAHRAPHMLVHYLRELANAFHGWYNAEQFIVEDDATRDARLTLALATRQVIRNGLALLGVSAPETM